MADDVVAIELGLDLTAALLITERVKSSGYRVEFLRMDAAGNAPGFAALQQHRLLVRRADADEVAAMIEPESV